MRLSVWTAYFILLAIWMVMIFVDIRAAWVAVTGIGVLAGLSWFYGHRRRKKQ